MDSTSNMDYYAEGRSPTLTPETVQIFSRHAIFQADRTTNEGKIDAMSGTLDMIAEHSNHVSRATSTFREEVNSSMLSIAGLRGGAGTIKCPFMKIAFSNAINPDYEEDNDDGLTREGNGKTTLFDQGWDGQLVFADTKLVAEKQVTLGLVAGYTAPGTTTPTAVPLEASLARKDGRTWRKFNPADKQLPNKFITECYTPAVRDKLKQIRDGDQLRLKTPSDLNARLDMSVIAMATMRHPLHFTEGIKQTYRENAREHEPTKTTTSHTHPLQFNNKQQPRRHTPNGPRNTTIPRPTQLRHYDGLPCR